tara:strand:- start:9797 stop:10378 length:582 start_codon:yes stop_codon:yes gene_type:complete
MTIIIASYWAKITLYLLKEICGIKIVMNDVNKMYKKGVIFAIRHESILDTILFLAYRPSIKYIVKKELLYVPFYGLFVWRSGHIIIDRKGQSRTLKKMLNQVNNYVNSSLNIIIFPHGTRVKPKKKVFVKSGIYAFYKYLNKTVVPIYLSTGKVWDKNGFIKRPGVVEIKFYKNIDIGLNKKEFLSILNMKLN